MWLGAEQQGSLSALDLRRGGDAASVEQRGGQVKVTVEMMSTSE